MFSMSNSHDSVEPPSSSTLYLNVKEKGHNASGASASSELSRIRVTLEEGCFSEGATASH